MKNPMITTVVVAVVVAALAFWGGMKYQQTKVAVTAVNGNGQFQGRGNRQGMNNGQGRFGGQGGRPIVGQIASQDDKSITVKMADGSSKIVLLPESVTISKTDTGAKTDLKVGEQVGIFGTENSDGSITAQNVQLNPMFRFGSNRPQSSGQPNRM